MAIQLQKGQRIDLTKGNPSLRHLHVGLGWDPIAPKKGLFGSLFGGSSSTHDMDCDASIIMLKNGKFREQSQLVYYGSLTSYCGSVIHSGDNLTGDGDGDDEVLFVDLTKVPRDVDRLVVVVNIYQAHTRKQHFGMIENAFIRIENKDTKQEFCNFKLNEDYTNKTALVAGEIYRHENEWKFSAVGTATNDAGLQEIVARYR